MSGIGFPILVTSVGPIVSVVCPFVDVRFTVVHEGYDYGVMAHCDGLPSYHLKTRFDDLDSAVLFCGAFLFEMFLDDLENLSDGNE